MKKQNIFFIGLILTIIIIMGLFDFLKPKHNGNNQFITEQTFNSNLTKQMQMTPQIMAQLRKINVSADKELKLEYFFYTNSVDKAKLFCDFDGWGTSPDQ